MNDVKTKIITVAKEKAFKYLEDCHQQYGHFPLFDFFPDFEEKKHRGWHYMYKSPFIQCCALDALLNAGYNTTNSLIKKAVTALLDFKEPGDLWRYWNVHEAEYPTFSDVDQTAISSFALRKVGIHLNNKKLLYSRIKNNGKIPTCINADLKILFINQYVYFWLIKNNKKVSYILNDLKWITLEDTEPCIVANVVAYLGENKLTKKSIEYVIDGWINDKRENYQHYDKKIILAYHIARAYKEGISSFFILGNQIIEYIEQSKHNFSFPEILMSYLSIYYFDKNHYYLNDLKDCIIQSIDSFNEPYPYTTEKKFIYYGGSGALTAAWFLEVVSYWDIEDSE